jgi:hypothetical protein
MTALIKEAERKIFLILENAFLDFSFSLYQNDAAHLSLPPPKIVRLAASAVIDLESPTMRAATMLMRANP